MSVVPEQAAFLQDFAKLITYAHDVLGFDITAGELLRTPEQQAIYVKAGRSTTLNSNHLKKLAGDLNFFKNGVLCYDIDILRPVGEYWQALSPKNSAGMFWKSFKDVPHFERRV